MLFLALAFVFFLTAPATIFYGQGYRFDLSAKKIVKTGGLLIGVWPKSANVYIDGKERQQTDFLRGQAFISNLLPRNYKVLVSKDGYFDWIKELPIQEKQLTEAPNIILVPKDFQWNIAEENVTKVWFNPNDQVVALEKKDQTLEFMDLSTNRTIKSLGLGARTENIIWSKEENILIALNDGSYLLINPYSNEKPATVIIKGQPRGIIFDPTSQQKVFVLKNYKISSVDLNSGTEITLLDKVLTFKILQDGLIWLDREGYLYKSNLSAKMKNKLAEKPIDTINRSSFKIPFADNQNIFIAADEDLYSWNSKSNALIKLSGGFKGLAFSPDSTKIAYFDSHEIRIMYLVEQKTQPPKKEGEIILLTRLSDSINDIQWLNSNYLMIKIGGKIKIAEIDDRDTLNIVDIRTPSASYRQDVFFDKSGKKIYILEDNKLSFSGNKLY